MSDHQVTPVSEQPRSTSRGRVLLTIARYWPAIGGAELHSREMVRNLQASGTQTAVFCHASAQDMSNELAILSAPERQFRDDQVTITQQPYQGFLKRPLNLLATCYPRWRIVRPLFNLLVRRFSTQAMIAAGRDSNVIHNVYSGMTMVSEASCAAAKKLGVPFVFTPLARTCDGPRSAWTTPRLRRLYQEADAVIALTAHEKTWLAGLGVAREKIHVCPMGPLLNATPSRLNFRATYQIGRDPMVLFLGRHDEHKGFHHVLEAARQVWQRQPNVHFVFFGPQTEASRAWFAKLHEPRITVIESPCQALKSSAIHACDLLCVPSVKESLGVVYLEAWQAGKPVIAGDIPVLRSIVEHGNDGFLCPPNPVNIAEKIERILSNKSLKRSMGQAGKRKVEQCYSWPAITKTLNQIYQSLPRKHASSDPMAHANACTEPTPYAATTRG